jgi:hypothetical protein
MLTGPASFVDYDRRIPGHRPSNPIKQVEDKLNKERDISPILNSCGGPMEQAPGIGIASARK